MASRSTTAKRPSHLLSTLAETAEEYIKLECARRRNQASIRRRSSLLEQYNVHVPTSRLKERQAQARHHEFLVRKDNKASVDVIIDRVRELAELYSSTRSGSSPSLSPMEKARFVAWADDVEKVLYDFEPSENHNLDPVVRMLEKLQFLQDGHVCLAEVAVDARMLLEKWERDGIFDTSDRDDDEVDGDEAGAPVGSAERESDDQFEQRSVSWQRDRHEGTQLQHSYPYETIRQRAAANVIKRNVLRWVRLQESFQDRVDEIQFFGKTTNSLMKELTSTANMRRPTAEQPGDIFALVKGKRDGMFAHSIGFMDLMNFSKYVALFPVDQAIRTVEELEMKRFLYKNRCALKMQTIWRKARKEFQARRMRKLVEELRLQRDKQEREEKERLALLSKSSTPVDTGDEKHKNVSSSGKKNRAVSMSTPPSIGSSRTSTRGDDAASFESQPVTPQSPRQRASVSGTKRKESKSRTSITAGDSQERKTRLNKVKSIHAREHNRFDEDDNDTKDVENAWQSFLDSTVDTESDTIPVTELASDPMPGTDGGDQPIDGGNVSADVVMPPSLDDDDWKNWSDGEENGGLRETDDDEADLKAEEKIARQLGLAASTALPVTPDVSEIYVEDQSELYHSRRLRNEATMAANLQEQRAHFSAAHASTSSLAPSDEPPLQSSYGFQLDDDADRFRVKKTRVGKLSIMAPFAEFEQLNQFLTSGGSEDTTRVKAPKAAEKKHLHEMDYGSIARSNLALLQLVDPLVSTDDIVVDDSDDDGDNDGDLNHETVRSVTRVRHKMSARKRRVDMIKHSIAVRETTPVSITYHVRHLQQQRTSVGKDVGVLEPAESSEKARQSSEEPVEHFSYPIPKLDFRREVVMRRASQHNAEPTSSISQPATSSESKSSSGVAGKRFGTQAEWLRSMGLDPTVRKSPRPPPSRLRTPQRPDTSKTSEPAGGNKTASSGVNNRQGTVKTRKRPKRFLPTLERPTDGIKAESAVQDDSLDWDADAPARLPRIRTGNSRQERRNGPQDDARSTSVAPSRRSSAHQSLSRDNDTVDGLNTENRRRKSSESGSSSELSSDELGGNVTSESDWSDDDASELDEKQIDERTAEPRDAGVSREEALLEEESGADAVTQDESGLRGSKNSPRVRVCFRVETKKAQQRTRTRKAKTKMRLRELGGRGELDQEDDEHLELSSDDSETISSIDDIIESDLRLSSPQSEGNAGARAPARGAPRSHHKPVRADAVFEDESREAEATSDTVITTAATARKRKMSARHASFQRLMMQYLGLLQCSPRVAMLPIGSSSH